MILVTGVRGQLGFDIVKELNKRNIDCKGVGSSEMDITDRENVEAVFRAVMPDKVIHCAAWTKVDDAEDHAPEAEAVNALGTENLALAAQRLGARFMYFSTDYVFDGEGGTPFRPDDRPDPIGVYGRTKLMGENIVRELIPDKSYILRLEWVYGINGKNFVKTMLRLAKTRDTLTVVDDQIGSPSYTPDIARLSADMIMTGSFGTYHVANSGYVSWCGFAREIFKEAGIDHVRVIPVSSDEYPAKAKRPHNSRFDTSLLKERGFDPLPPWQDALRRFIKELKEKEPELF